MIELWAEAGPCEDSIDTALEYAQTVYDSGASALKVQWYRADTLVTPTASRYDNTSGDASTQWEMFSKSIYPYQRWEPVIEFCRDRNIKFIPSVFDMEAVEVANEYELPILKIASGDLTYHELIQFASDGRQLALSTGAATLDEIELAYEKMYEGTHILMACHLEYPTPYHRANLARTYSLQYRFPLAVPGFSDHTPGVDTIPLIVATGCQVIEKHVTLEPNRGYDSDFALDPSQLEAAVQKIQGTVGVMGNAEINPDEDELAAREGARRSPYASRDIPAGTQITRSDIDILRPYYGLHPAEAFRLVGRSFESDIPKHGQFPTPE